MQTAFFEPSFQIATLSDQGGNIATWDISSGNLVQTDEWNDLIPLSTGPKAMVADAAQNFVHVSTEPG